MVNMYHSCLIHLSADGHLGFFHVLTIINSAVMNIGNPALLCLLHWQAGSLPLVLVGKLHIMWWFSLLHFGSFQSLSCV